MSSHRGRSPKRGITGQKGVNITEEIVLAMDYLWHPSGPFDVGIDGRIELRDAAKEQPLGRYLGVQTKGWSKYTAETKNGFEYLCEESEFEYWMDSSDPVLLVCTRPATREAWAVCVTDYFRDPERKAARRVVFDKQRDRFVADRAAELMRLGLRHEPVVPRSKPAPAEDVVTNLLPIVEHGGYLWSAPTSCRTREDAHQVYSAAGEEDHRASDYLIRDGRIFSLRDPRTCSLRHLCDLADVASEPIAMWAHSAEPRQRRYWTELLRRCLLQQTKSWLRWHPSRKVFFIPAEDPPEEIHIDGPNGRRLAVKVDLYEDRTGQQRLGYIRHVAFHPGFVRIDDGWHLVIEPDYVFTHNSEQIHWRNDELLAGIKRLDKNSAVLGHLRMWEHQLARPPSLLDVEAPLLTFGALVTARVDVGIDDALWRGKNTADPKQIDGQEELAA